MDSPIRPGDPADEPTDGYELESVGITPDLPVDGPLSNIRLVNVKLLITAEAGFCVNNSIGGAEAARRFAAEGQPLWSSLSRPSVI